jgi:dimethylamine monooxygenase subunit A
LLEQSSRSGVTTSRLVAIFTKHSADRRETGRSATARSMANRRRQAIHAICRHPLTGTKQIERSPTAMRPPVEFERMPFLHAPYASRNPPFSIGLSPIDLARWIEQDELLVEQLALKASILGEEGAAAFDALSESQAGQAEALELLSAHLPARYPQTYRRRGDALLILPSDQLIELRGEPPLRTASRLVQEDLLLMRRGENGWRLVAGSLCFPSTWVLAEKLGRDMDAIHAPAPGYAGKMAAMVARIFDNLKADQLVERFNWSIYGDARLRYAQSKQDPLERFPPGQSVSRAHIRVERQTLRRLPLSGDILFTVRVHVDPIAAFSRNSRGRELASALRDQLAALSEEQLAYKGIVEARERLIGALSEFSR